MSKETITQGKKATRDLSPTENLIEQIESFIKINRELPNLEEFQEDVNNGLIEDEDLDIVNAKLEESREISRVISGAIPLFLESKLDDKTSKQLADGIVRVNFYLRPIWVRDEVQFALKNGLTQEMVFNIIREEGGNPDNFGYDCNCPGESCPKKDTFYHKENANQLIMERGIALIELTARTALFNILS